MKKILTLFVAALLLALWTGIAGCVIVIKKQMGPDPAATNAPAAKPAK